MPPALVHPDTLPQEGFARLTAVMAQLRAAEGGCPWDREQTLATLRAYLLEESHELLEAIDALGPAAHALPVDVPPPVEPSAVAHFREELGDVLLQIAFQSRIAEERGWFDAEDVARGIADKMIRRHPHVFQTPEAARHDTAAQVLHAWEQRKRAEGKGALAGVPRNLPALLRGQRMGEKAARIGFDWQDAAAVLAKVDEEFLELREAMQGGDKAAVADELGDLFFALTSLARHTGVDAEQAARGTLDKFTKRFGYVEREVEARYGKTYQATPEQLEALWQEAKLLESPRSSEQADLS